MSRSTVRPVLLLLGALSCTGASGRSEIPDMRAVEPPLLLHEIELPHPISSENDAMGFAIATAIGFLGGRLAVVETGNDRIVLFDRDYRPVTYIGREGAGPGELRDPADIATWRSELAVTEVNNGRVSVFDSSGMYRRSFSIPNGFSTVGYGPDGTIYVNAYDGRNYLLAANRDGTLRPFGERPWDLYPSEALTAPASQISGYIRFAVAATGTVFVYDPVIGALVGLDPTGRQISLRGLPARLVDDLRRQSALVARDFGGSGRSAPANITDLSLTDDGRLLLLFPSVGAIGLLVNVSDWSAREIRWGPGLDPKIGGFGGMLRGDTLYRLSMDDLRLFRLAPE